MDNNFLLGLLSLFALLSTGAMTFQVLSVGFSTLWKNAIDWFAVGALVLLWVALAIGLLSDNPTALLVPIATAIMVYTMKFFGK